MEPESRHLRDADRIERIKSPTEARIRLVLYTAPLCRMVRKDFNIVSAKMFLARGDRTLQLSKVLRDLERAAVEAELAAERYRSIDYRNVEFPGTAFDIRVISPFSNRYQRSISRTDAVNYLLLQAETRGILNRKDRQQIIRPAILLLHEVKQIALELPSKGLSDQWDPVA